MKQYLLPADRRQYKANLHCHSTFSDGRFDVATLKKHYVDRGYSVVAFSDHNCLVPHPELRSDDFVPLTAIEVDVNGPKGHTYHLNFFSPDKDRSVFPAIERVYGTEGINRIIKICNDAGFLCQYNHPRWSFQTPDEFIGLEGLWGFEVFNTGCEVDMIDGWGDYEYEVMCRDGKCKPVATATDDNHNGCRDIASPYNDSFGGWTMIFAPELSYDAIFEAMKRGDCYASTGPEIRELYAEDGKVVVKCSPAQSIFIRFETRRSDKRRSHGDELEGAEFDIGGSYDHFRIEVKDSHGNKALTRAYRFDEIR
jgi:hypothetical protein